MARAADRAGVGVYTQEITSEGKPRRNKKGEIVLRCVGIAESDIPAVARHINDTPGNPTFGSPKPATVKRHLASRFAAAKRRVHGVRVRRPAAAFRAKTRA